jgi:hypothetical protein
MDDDATSTNAGHHSPNDEPEQQQSPPPNPGGGIPIEYQTYEVDDVTMSRMDPLEYTFRKYIPIPRVYFWDITAVSPDDLPRRIKLWHYTIYYLGEGLRIAEKGGEVVANVLGLNDGPFDYVTSGMIPEEMVASCAVMDERRQKRVEMEDTTNNDEGGGV